MQKIDDELKLKFLPRTKATHGIGAVVIFDSANRTLHGWYVVDRLDRIEKYYDHLIRHSADGSDKFNMFKDIPVFVNQCNQLFSEEYENGEEVDKYNIDISEFNSNDLELKRLLKAGIYLFWNGKRFIKRFEHPTPPPLPPAPKPDIILDTQDKTSKDAYKGYHFLAGVYAHGKVEDGYDLIHVNDKIMDMIDCYLRWMDEDVGFMLDNLTFSSPNHDNTNVRMLVWKVKNFNDYLLKGYVIDMNDEKEMKWSYSQYMALKKTI